MINQIRESFSSFFPLNSMIDFFIPTIKFGDIIELIIFSFIIYKLIVSLKNTRAWVIMKGFLLLFIFFILSYLFSLNEIVIIFKWIALFCTVGVFVIFQPELRRLLEQIGTKNFSSITILGLIDLFKRKNKIIPQYTISTETINSIVDAVFTMAPVKTGALIVIENKIPLNDYISTGINLDASISTGLLVNIFEHNTPLHDGAVIVKNNRIVAATCYLPLSDNMKISKSMGTRHRAGLGISEIADSITITVSEETGNVSFMQNGKMYHNITKKQLIDKLTTFQKETSQQDKETSISKDRLIHNYHYKILSIVLSILLWFTLVNISNPIETIKIDDIPINIINDEVIETIGKTYSIISEEEVSLILKDRRSVLTSINKNDITVYADMSEMSYVLSVPLYAEIKDNTTTEVIFAKKDSIKIEISPITSKELPITIEKTGKEAYGYYVKELHPSKSSFIINGPDYLIKTIDKVVAKVNINGAKSGFEKTCNLLIIDKNGEIIKSDKLSIDEESVKIYGTFYRTKEIPVNINFVKDENEKYEIEKIEYETKFITIAGEETDLININNLQIDITTNISIIGNEGNQYVKVINVSDYLPNNTFIVDENEANIEATITYIPFETKELTLETEHIEIRNLDKKLTVNFVDEQIIVNISGLKNNISNLDAIDLLPYIDCSNIKSGEYNVNIMFGNKENILVQDSILTKIIVKREEA